MGCSISKPNEYIDLDMKILIIEDEKNLLDVLKIKLSDAGYEVETALDGISGLEKAKTVSPDLILLDLLLPKLDGMSLLRELKKEEKMEKIPVVVLTNFFNQKLYDTMIEAGAAGYLIKSDYKIEDIVAKVKGILSK